MALPFPIAPSQVDANSPVDDNLANSIKQDLEDLDTRLLSNKNFEHQFKINGDVFSIVSKNGVAKRLDGALIIEPQTFTKAKMFADIPPSVYGGNLVGDLRKYKRIDAPITAVDRLFAGSAVNSITQVAAINTQSITKVTPQVNTQSISRWKATVNIASIILLGNNLVRYNLSSAVDADWQLNDSITFASCTSGANNGNFSIVRVNDDGLNNIIVTNASGVAQTSAAGNVALNKWSYNLVNPANANFVVGEQAVFGSHSTGANNGNFTIKAVNSGGNNVIVANTAGVAQAGVAGTVDCGRLNYNYSGTVTSDFAVGELVQMASHTSGSNNGNLTILAASASVLTILTTANTTQGGVAGTARPLRWIYTLANDPVGNVAIGDKHYFVTTSNANNAGEFVVKGVNVASGTNIVVYNANGVAQGAPSGNSWTEKVKISFATDQSSKITTSSNVEIGGGLPLTSDLRSNFDVVEVNRGGGANYNIVVKVPTVPPVAGSTPTVQLSPAGRVELESKSILSSYLTITNSNLADNLNIINAKKCFFVEDLVMNANAVFTTQDVTDGAFLACDLRDNFTDYENIIFQVI